MATSLSNLHDKLGYCLSDYMSNPPAKFIKPSGSTLDLIDRSLAALADPYSSSAVVPAIA